MGEGEGGGAKGGTECLPHVRSRHFTHHVIKPVHQGAPGQRVGKNPPLPPPPLNGTCIAHIAASQTIAPLRRPPSRAPITHIAASLTIAVTLNDAGCPGSCWSSFRFDKRLSSCSPELAAKRKCGEGCQCEWAGGPGLQLEQLEARRMLEWLQPRTGCQRGGAGGGAARGGDRGSCGEAIIEMAGRTSELGRAAWQQESVCEGRTKIDKVRWQQGPGLLGGSVEVWM